MTRSMQGHPTSSPPPPAVAPDPAELPQSDIVDRPQLVSTSPRSTRSGQKVAAGDAHARDLLQASPSRSTRTQQGQGRAAQPRTGQGIPVTVPASASPPVPAGSASSSPCRVTRAQAAGLSQVAADSAAHAAEEEAERISGRSQRMTRSMQSADVISDSDPSSNDAAPSSEEEEQDRPGRDALTPVGPFDTDTAVASQSPSSSSRMRHSRASAPEIEQQGQLQLGPRQTRSQRTQALHAPRNRGQCSIATLSCAVLFVGMNECIMTHYLGKIFICAALCYSLQVLLHVWERNGSSAVCQIAVLCAQAQYLDCRCLRLIICGISACSIHECICLQAVLMDQKAAVWRPCRKLEQHLSEVILMRPSPDLQQRGCMTALHSAAAAPETAIQPALASQ